jgi:hypothetical protein
MDVSSSAWITLDVTLRRLVERERDDLDAVFDGGLSHEARTIGAKVDICTAIAALSQWVRVESADDPIGVSFEKHDIDIPPDLNPSHFDWSASRPLWPWRVRAAGGGDWQLRAIGRIVVSSDDVTWGLLRDFESMPLSDGADSPTPPIVDLPAYWIGLSKSSWSPSEATRKAASRLAMVGRLPLSEAVSILAFGSRTDPNDRGELEVVSRRQQAARAICDAAANDDVHLYGVRSKLDAASERLPVTYFFAPRCLGQHHNAIGPDFDRTVLAKPDDEWGAEPTDWYKEWFGVQVGAASFVEWLREEIQNKQRKEWRRQHSKRLFDHPFWSFGTTISWIAFRDPERLNVEPTKMDPFDLDGEPNSEVCRTLLRRALSEARLVSATGESSLVAESAMYFCREDVIGAFSGAPAGDIQDVLDGAPPKISTDISSPRKPGQPSKIKFIFDQARERMEGKDAASSLGAEANALYKWGKKNIAAGAEMPSLKTITNNLSAWWLAWANPLRK